MRNAKYTYLSLIAIFILSLIPLLWFKNNYLISGGDCNQFTSVPHLIHNNFYFLTKSNLGQNNLGLHSYIASLGAFWQIFRIFELSDPMIQRLWFVFIWFFSMLGMYLLVKQLTKNKFSEIGGLIGACLYMINIYNGSLASSISINLTFIALPYLMLLTIRILRNPGEENINVILFGLIILFSGVLVLNPGYSYILFLLPILYILYYTLFTLNLKSILRSTKFISKIFIVCFLSTAFFLIPYIYAISSIFEKFYPSASAGFFGKNSIQEAFRFLASWAFRAIHYKMPYSTWADSYYNNPFIVFAAYLIPILVFISILFLKKLKKDIFFFAFIALLGLFLAKGIGSPLGRIYQWCFNNVPLFTAFREPWSKFTQITVFSFAVLIGLGFCEIKHYFKNSRTRKTIIFFFTSASLLCVTFAAFPVFTSDIFSGYWNGSVKGNYVKKPEYWYGTSDFFKQKNANDIVFLTPRHRLSIYEWDYGISTMDNVPALLLDNQTIKYESNLMYGQEMVNLVYGLIKPNCSYNFSVLLKLLGSKYILQQNDVDWRFLHAYACSPEIMAVILENQPNLSKINTIGELDIYEIDENSFVPEIYIPNNTSLIYGTLDCLPELTFTGFLHNKPMINFIYPESIIKSIDHLNLYNNIAAVLPNDNIDFSLNDMTLIYDLNKIQTKTIAVKQTNEAYSVKVAYSPFSQEEKISYFKTKTFSAQTYEKEKIVSFKTNLLNPNKNISNFSIKPILANWEYNTLFYQPYIKKLTIENFNDKTLDIDLCIRFKYFWMGTINVYKNDMQILTAQKSLDNFNDFIEIHNISITPGTNHFQIICVPDKCDKNWPGEIVTVEKDLGIILSGNTEDPYINTSIKDEMILETDYKLTVFNGIKQIDLLCYLSSSKDDNVNALTQITIDDWLMQNDYAHFEVDLIQATKQRLNTANYKIQAIDIVCYSSRGGEKSEESMAGDLILKDFSITHTHQPEYSVYSKYFNNHFTDLNLFKNLSINDFHIVSQKNNYPFVIATKKIIPLEKDTKLYFASDKMFSPEWLILEPLTENKNNTPSGSVSKIVRINPVMYKAHVNVKEPCFIVLSKNYHPGWKAFIRSITNETMPLNRSVLFTYIRNKLERRKQLKNHIKVNGFSNAWIFSKEDIEELKRSQEIVFIFYPQILQEIGILITFSFLVWAAFYITFIKLKMGIMIIRALKIKGVAKTLLYCSNLLYFVFAYNLFFCAYYIYKGLAIHNSGELADRHAINAFYSLILFVVLKTVIMKLIEKSEIQSSSQEG